MTDAGMFDVIINFLMKFVKDNVIGVCVMTAIIAMIGHLDGAGAATFCIVIPAMLPIYKKMHMRATTLLRITVISMGVLNLMPWAGPTMRAAAVLGMEASSFWHTILPIQICGVLLTVAVIALLILDIFPSYVPFMAGVAASILVNYPGAKMQKKVINNHAGPALTMCSTLMAAAVLMGVLVKEVEGTTSVITCMSGLISTFLPAVLGRHLPLVIGILSVPLALAFDTDSYFYGMLPVMIGIGEGFGIPALPIAAAMAVCRNCATFISPMVPATLLGVGLADVDINQHIKSNFLWVWGFSFICMIAAILFGIIPV